MLRTILVATKVVSIDNIDRSDFAASKSDTIDTASREGIRIQQGDTRRREVFISFVEIRIADGHEVVLLGELSGDRVNTNIHDSLAQGADRNFSRRWWSGGIVVITRNI
jgi:hypothetical protein